MTSIAVRIGIDAIYQVSVKNGEENAPVNSNVLFPQEGIIEYNGNLLTPPTYRDPNPT